MKNKKSILDNENESKQKLIFCTECGEELDMFVFSEQSKDLKKIKERFMKCKETGKFKGDKCAMIFIAESNEELFTDE